MCQSGCTWPQAALIPAEHGQVSSSTVEPGLQLRRVLERQLQVIICGIIMSFLSCANLDPSGLDVRAALQVHHRQPAKIEVATRATPGTGRAGRARRGWQPTSIHSVVHDKEAAVIQGRR